MTKLKMQIQNNNFLIQPGYQFIFSSLVVFLLAFSATHSLSQVNPRCLTPQYDSLLQVKYPQLQKSRQQFNDLLIQHQQYQKRDPLHASAKTQAEETIIIPVVIHVIHNNPDGTIGGTNNSNITNDQIVSQIEVLNEDYRRQEGTNGFNTHPAGADVNIEFRLAQIDPDGLPTTGITRTYNSQASFDVNTDDELLKSLSWPTDRYLNIWVTSLKNKYLGYSQFPDGNGTQGLADYGGLAKTDGVVINHSNFGRRTGTANTGIYRDGRTTTHEVAHWLGLLHTWGDEDCGDDYCEDTPQISGPNNSTSCPELSSNCTGATVRNMIENFLDYSPDQCMNIFTQDQKNRIRSVLAVSPRRRDLVLNAPSKLASKNLTLKLSPNPTDDELKIEMKASDLDQTVTVEVVNMLGKSILAIEYVNPGQPISLDVRSLPTGMYILRVATPENAYTGKFLVKRSG